MTKGNKLIKDTLLYGIANFGSSILSFFMLPLYTHYFTTEEFGFWDLILTTSTLLTPFITFELTAAVYRWLLDTEEYEDRRTIISTGLIMIIRNTLLFAIIGYILIFTFSIPYGSLALGFIVITVLNGFIQQCARGLRFNKLFASLGIIQSACIVLLNLVFIFIFKLRVEAFFYSAIIAGIIVILFALRQMQFKQYIHIKFYSKKMLKSFLSYSIPIIPGAASWWIMTMSDRYMITIYLGIEYNGIYAIASKIPSLLLMVSSVFFLAWKDSAILEFQSKDKDAYYSLVFKHFFRLMASSVICLALLTKPILALLVSNEFYSAWHYIGILLLGTFFHILSLFWSAGFHGAKKTNIIFVTSLVGACLNILINLIFIKKIGLYATVISTTIAFFITWMVRVFHAKRYFKISIDYQDVFVLLPLMVIAVIAPFVLNGVGIAWSLVVSLLLFLIYNREIFLIVCRKIMESFGEIKENKKTS